MACEWPVLNVMGPKKKLHDPLLNCVNCDVYFLNPRTSRGGGTLSEPKRSLDLSYEAR